MEVVTFLAEYEYDAQRVNKLELGNLLKTIFWYIAKLNSSIQKLSKIWMYFVAQGTSVRFLLASLS